MAKRSRASKKRSRLRKKHEPFSAKPAPRRVAVDGAAAEALAAAHLDRLNEREREREVTLAGKKTKIESLLEEVTHGAAPLVDREEVRQAIRARERTEGRSGVYSGVGEHGVIRNLVRTADKRSADKAKASQRKQQAAQSAAVSVPVYDVWADDTTTSTTKAAMTPRNRAVERAEVRTRVARGATRSTVATALSVRPSEEEVSRLEKDVAAAKATVDARARPPVVTRFRGELKRAAKLSAAPATSAHSTEQLVRMTEKAEADLARVLARAKRHSTYLELHRRLSAKLSRLGAPPLAPALQTMDEAIAKVQADLDGEAHARAMARRARENRKRVHDAAVASGRAAARLGSSSLPALDPLQRTGGEALLAALGKRARQSEGAADLDDEQDSSLADPVRLSTVVRANAGEGLASFVDAYRRKGHLEL